MPKKMNKGEWSEIYVFLKLLYDGKLQIADSDLKPLNKLFYVIIGLIKDQYEYQPDFKQQKVIVIDNQTNQITNYTATLQNFAKYIQQLQTDFQTKKSTFAEPQLEQFLQQLQITNLKAKSSSKSDLAIQLHDQYTNTNPVVEFSIKSYIGGRPTLLNASNGTAINFRFDKPIPKTLRDTINQIKSRHTIQDRLTYLKDHNYNLVFDKFTNDTFNFNLQMIDSNIPQILGMLYYCSYFIKGRKIKDVVHYYCQHYHQNENLISYKVKNLLVSIALGMVPETQWNGLDTANGGYIVVKKDSSIVGYNIYNRDLLKDYLYNHTNFDSPSLSRYHNGGLIDTNNNFKLVCQIRFSNSN